MVGKVSFYGKTITGLNDDVRISKRLNIPSFRLRGFEKGKVGPTENNDYIGGNHISTLNLSATLPNIFQGLDNLDVGVFLDAANVWGVDYDSNLDDNSKIRSSTGAALNLMTPIGPLSFSFATPISKASSDKLKLSDLTWVLNFNEIFLIKLFSFTGLAIANENIRFININYIINNSEVGKSLNKLIENKNKQIQTELKKISKKLEEDKNKIITQKNVLKKEEIEELVKEYDDNLKKFNEIRKEKTSEFNQFRINSKKKIIDILNPIITSFLKKESIQILFQKDKIIFGDEVLILLMKY